MPVWSGCDEESTEAGGFAGSARGSSANLGSERMLRGAIGTSFGDMGGSGAGGTGFASFFKLDDDAYGGGSVLSRRVRFVSLGGLGELSWDPKDLLDPIFAAEISLTTSVVWPCCS
jgi:hypothetical protein